MSDVAIRCTKVGKTFRIPKAEHSTLRGRILHPRSRTRHSELQALGDVTFEVNNGEFFGIVGRNGSGKSTLLKLLAGIYKADEGTVDVHGTLAPFIELGVGFNEDLSGLDNVYVNGAILGLTRPEIEARLPHIVRFAELEGFMQLKLRNFSSGMMMRLAFAIAVQADADILLVDEVLAVGDERFQRKCQDVFRERRRRGQTVIFVSHDMSAVESFCDRALLLDSGRVVALGPTPEVVPEYHRLNRSDEIEIASDDPSTQGTVDESAIDELLGRGRPRGRSRIKLGWRDQPDAPRLELNADEPMCLCARLALSPILTKPRVRILVLNEAGGVVGEIDVRIDDSADPNSKDHALDIDVENALTEGRYRLIAELHAVVEETKQPVLADTADVTVDVIGHAAVGSTRFRFQTTPHPTSTPTA